MSYDQGVEMSGAAHERTAAAVRDTAEFPVPVEARLSVLGQAEHALAVSPAVLAGLAEEAAIVNEGPAPLPAAYQERTKQMWGSPEAPQSQAEFITASQGDVAAAGPQSSSELFHATPDLVGTPPAPEAPAETPDAHAVWMNSLVEDYQANQERNN